ncbi:MAG: hypothetical protein U0174_08165 [Polyangiaceae bacterium]
MIARWLRYFRRKKYRRGVRLHRFLAPDILREVDIVDDAEVEEGYVLAKIRTWNVLYLTKSGGPPPEPGEAVRIAIERLWEWRGRPWGGPVPEDDGSGTI